MKKILLTSVVGLMGVFNLALADSFVLPKAVEIALERMVNDSGDIPAWFDANSWVWDSEVSSGGLTGNFKAFTVRALWESCKNAIDPTAGDEFIALSRDILGEVVSMSITDRNGICKVIIENVVAVHNEIIENQVRNKVMLLPNKETRMTLQGLSEPGKAAADDYYVAYLDVESIDEDYLTKDVYDSLSKIPSVFRTADDGFVCHLGKKYCKENQDAEIVFAEMISEDYVVATAEYLWSSPSLREKALANMIYADQGLMQRVQKDAPMIKYADTVRVFYDALKPVKENRIYTADGKYFYAKIDFGQIDTTKIKDVEAFKRSLNPNAVFSASDEVAVCMPGRVYRGFGRLDNATSCAAKGVRGVFNLTKNSNGKDVLEIVTSGFSGDYSTGLDHFYDTISQYVVNEVRVGI